MDDKLNENTANTTNPKPSEYHKDGSDSRTRSDSESGILGTNHANYKNYACVSVVAKHGSTNIAFDSIKVFNNQLDVKKTYTVRFYVTTINGYAAKVGCAKLPDNEREEYTFIKEGYWVNVYLKKV